MGSGAEEIRALSGWFGCFGVRRLTRQEVDGICGLPPASSLAQPIGDGGEKFQLTDSYSIMPQWSPDSKKIAYSDWSQIYVISADGGIPEKLIPNPNREVLPTWSPDGKSIAFSDYPLPGQFMGIKVLDVATRKISIMPGSQGVIGPAWSPDGKYMVAWGYNPTRVVLYSAQTGTWKVLRVFYGPTGMGSGRTTVSLYTSTCRMQVQSRCADFIGWQSRTERGAG